MKPALFSLCICGLLAAPADAAVMIQPQLHSHNVTLFSANYDIENLNNQVGLSAPYQSGSTDYQTYLDSGPTQASSPIYDYYVMANEIAATFVFDLGALYQLTNVLVWNGHTGVNTRLKDFRISISNTADFSTFTDLGIHTSAPGQSSYPVEVEGFSLTPTQGRYVRFEALTNQGGIRLLIGEIAFAGNAVPEPSSALLGALGALALIRRRR